MPQRSQSSSKRLKACTREPGQVRRGGQCVNPHTSGPFWPSQAAPAQRLPAAMESVKTDGPRGHPVIGGSEGCGGKRGYIGCSSTGSLQPICGVTETPPRGLTVARAPGKPPFLPSMDSCLTSVIRISTFVRLKKHIIGINSVP